MDGPWPASANAHPKYIVDKIIMRIKALFITLWKLENRMHKIKKQQNSPKGPGKDFYVYTFYDSLKLQSLRDQLSGEALRAR